MAINHPNKINCMLSKYKRPAGLLPVLFLFSVVGYSQITLTSGGGYLDKPSGVITYVVKKEAVTDATQILSLSANEHAKTLQYVDGFGRSIETIVAGGSPNGKDIISFTRYDELGRVSKGYLPYEAGTTTGVYTDPATAITAQASFYTTNTTANKIANDISPFAQSEFETSPLQRVLKQGNVGEGFQPTQHYKTMNYRSSISADNVLKWSSSGTASGYYAANDLNVAEGTDEAGNTATVFKDKMGRLILKRQEITTGTYADTYYGYDNAGNVIYIVPPKAIKKMQEISSSFDITVTPNLVYQFWYDAKNRVKQKKVPGAKEVYMIYDPLDRLVLMQDGNMRFNNSKAWLYFKYDNANRVIIQGMYTHGTVQTQAQMQGYVDGLSCYALNSTTYFEQRLAGTSGYSNQCFPTTGTEERQYNYFDNYDFDYDGSPDYNHLPQGLANEASATTNTYGLPTGTKKKILRSSTWLIETSFYDKYYHVIQVRSNNQLKTNVTDHTTNVVNFAGQVVQAKQLKNINNPTGIVNNLAILVSTRYEYDDMGRLTKVKQTNPFQPEITVAKYEYNSLGQLVDKKLHSTDGTDYLQSVDFRYNIRGQLTSINNIARGDDGGLTNDDDNDVFGMELFYDKEDGDNGLANTANFTGMISGVKWSAKTPATPTPDEKSFIYTYDKLNRLTASAYKARQNGSIFFDKDIGGFNETLSYDDNGNITGLQRNAVLGGTVTAIDDLTYTYKSSDIDNQLDNITETISGITPEYGYRNITGSSSAYTYDDNGNLATDPKKGTTISYNELNKPTLIYISATKKIEFRYDATGTRVSKYVTNGYSTKYIEYIGGYVIENDILSYYNMAEGRVRNDGNAYSFNLKMEYFITDHQGNTRISFEDDGTKTNTAIVTQENSYYAFGMQMAGGYTPTNPNKKLYNAGSEWQDDIDGVMDYYSTFFREYDPMIGRFNSVDPMAEITDDITTYAYANNNPVMMNDPLGDFAAGGNGYQSPTMRDILDRYAYDPFSSGWTYQDGGGGGSPFDSYGLYNMLKNDLAGFGHDNLDNNKKGNKNVFKNLMSFFQNIFRNKRKQARSQRNSDKDGGNPVTDSPSQTILFSFYVLDPETSILIGKLNIYAFEEIDRASDEYHRTGVKIKVGYLDFGSGYTDFNWVQTLTTNQPHKQAKGDEKTYVDGSGPGNWPYYYEENEIGSHYNFDGYNVNFVDRIRRYDNDVYVYANLSLVSRNRKEKDDSYLIEIRYGFRIDNTGKTNLVYPSLIYQHFIRTPW